MNLRPNLTISLCFYLSMVSIQNFPQNNHDMGIACIITIILHIRKKSNAQGFWLNTCRERKTAISRNVRGIENNSFKKGMFKSSFTAKIK